MTSPEWFDLKNYPREQDPKYWILMIGIRISLLKRLENLKDFKKKHIHFEKVIEKTIIHAHPKSDYDTALAHFERSAWNHNHNLPSIIPMSVEDLEAIKNWSNASSDYKENLEISDKYFRLNTRTLNEIRSNMPFKKRQDRNNEIKTR